MRRTIKLISALLIGIALPAMAQHRHDLAVPAARQHVRTPAAPAAPGPIPVIEWTDDWFDADTYPSLKSAAVSLGARWGREASRRLDQQVKEIEIHSRHNVPDGIAHAVRTGIASALTGVTVQVAEEDCASSATVHCVSLTLYDQEDHHWRMGVRESGQFTVQSDLCTVNARYTEKPWVEDFGAFVNVRPGESWLIARSPDPCLTEHEAATKAIASATQQIFPLVRDRLRDGRWGHADDQRLLDQIRHQLAMERKLVPDKFLQRAERPYGGVFRQAILVDLSPPNLEKLIMLSRQNVVGHRQSFAAVLISAAALFLVVYLLYLFVNSMTRGYFVWSLRMVAATILVLGIIVLLALA